MAAIKNLKCTSNSQVLKVWCARWRYEDVVETLWPSEMSSSHWRCDLEGNNSALPLPHSFSRCSLEMRSSAARHSHCELPLEVPNQ